VSLRLLLCLIALVVPVATQNECEIPQPLASIIEHQWRDWRLLHIADLTAEDQKLWTYARGRVCPGVARGHFLESQGFAYAMAVVRGKQEAVLIAEGAGERWTLQVVMPPTHVARFRVLWAAKPGVYEDITTHRRTQTLLQPIALETIAEGATIFIRQKNRFIEVQTGE